MATRRRYYRSRRLRMCALVCVVAVPAFYLFSCFVSISWWPSASSPNVVWVGSGSLGYSTVSQRSSAGAPGFIADLTPFQIDGDFDLKQRSGGWFFDWALWPAPLAAAAFFAWAWRWRTLAEGACEGCEYPLGGRPVCPECGRSAACAAA